MKRWPLISILLIALLVVVFGGYMLIHTMRHASTVPAPAAPMVRLPQQDVAAVPSAPVAVAPTPAAKAPTKQPAQRVAAAPTKGMPPSPAAQAGQPRGAGMRRPPVFQLMRLFSGMTKLNDITPAQAKEILALMTPVRSKATLTPDEASKIQAQLQAVLTDAQTKALEAAATAARQRFAQGGGPGGPGGPGAGGPGGGVRGGFGGQPGQGGPGGPGGRQRGGGGPGGPGGPGGFGGAGGRGGGAGGPGGRPAMPANFNPFYSGVDSANPMAARMKGRMDTSFQDLQTKANSTK